MWWAYIPVLAILIVEAFFAMELLSWRGSLNHYQRQIDRDRQGCYACITKADVTSFSWNSAASFCSVHKAHAALIHDLEEKISKSE